MLGMEYDRNVWKKTFFKRIKAGDGGGMILEGMRENNNIYK